jgi:2-amino-4-hydroxy-6-hydroxymethyldihydropteridine diphosphokinase
VKRVTHAAQDYVLGLGSNLGNRLGFFRTAVRHLRLHAEITAFSALYESAAVGPAQPDYLNAAVRLRSLLEPSALLALQLEIERAAGRVRVERWGPRTLDLDLLFVVGQTVDQPGLVVPHRELTRRPFALLPLIDVMPEARDPHSGRPYSELAAELDRTGVRELENSRAGWLE